MNEVSTQDTRAIARYNVAQAIVAADNSYEILKAFAGLLGEYEAVLDKRIASGDKHSALRWGRALEEIGTIAMCAQINLEESGK